MSGEAACVDRGAGRAVVGQLFHQPWCPEAPEALFDGLQHHVANVRARDAGICLVISILEGGRQRIIDGAPIAWPTLSDAAAVGLKKRFGLDYNDKAVWTGTGDGTVFKIIERYKAVKMLLESGKLAYVCLAPKTINRSYYSGEGSAGEWAFAFDGENEMFLCKP